MPVLNYNLAFALQLKKKKHGKPQSVQQCSEVDRSIQNRRKGKLKLWANEKEGMRGRRFMAQRKSRCKHQMG